MSDQSTYSSERGGGRAYGGTILPDSPSAGLALNMMDDPRHQRVRQLVSHGFTPRTIARLADELRRRAGALLDGVAGAGTFDFVTDVATELPMQAICILPACRRPTVTGSSRRRTAASIPRRRRLRGERDLPRGDGQLPRTRALIAAAGCGRPTTCCRSSPMRRCPANPSALTDQELLLFFRCFSPRARTRRATRRPAVISRCSSTRTSWRRCSSITLRSRPPSRDGALDEPGRVQPPHRDADAMLGGYAVRAGDKVVFWEASANRDERVFPKR